MPIPAFVPQVWAAKMTAILEQHNPWLSLFNRDYEGDASGYGKIVKVPTFTKDVTARDYTANQDMADAETATGATVDLSIDQQKYFRVYVDDVDQRQSRVDLYEPFMRKGAIAISNTIDAHCQATLTSADVVAGRTITVDGQKGGTSVLRKAAAQTTLRALPSLKAAMFKNNVPRTSQPWIVLHPDIVELLEQYLLVETGIDYGGKTGEILQSGMLSRQLAGFRVEVSNRVPVVSDAYNLVAGTNAAASYVGQITTVEQIRHPNRFGDDVRGLYVYGSEVTDPQFLFRLSVGYDVDGT